MSFKLNAKAGVDYLTLDYEGFRQMMIDRLKVNLPEYTDYSETDMGVVLIELAAHGLDIISYYKDRQALECFLPTARERKNVIMHCKLFGYTLDSATPSKFVQVFRLKHCKGLSVNAKSGLVIVDGVRHENTILRVKTKAEAGQPSIYFEVIGGLNEKGEFTPTFEIPAYESHKSSLASLENAGATINNSITYGTDMNYGESSDTYGDEVDPATGEYLYRAVVVQGLTIPNELLAYSDGTASQKYVTSYTPALDYTPVAPYNEDVVHVYVTENGEMKEWTRVENFLLSSSQSRHYTYTTNEYGEGVFEFGNGISGAIPPKNAKIESTYRIGGGIETNVGANTIIEMDSKFACIDATYNPDTAFVLGADMESIEEARVKAPASLRTLDRAVTTKDYEDIGILLDFITSAQSVFYDSDGISTIRVIDSDDNILHEYIMSDSDDEAEANKENDASGFTEANHYAGYVRVWLMPNKVEADPDNPDIVYISEDNMSYIANEKNGYYYEKKMIGQKLEINPANIRYVVPVIKITKDVNYTEETVKNAVKARLIELMKLGSYKLKEDLIWSDLVRNLVDSTTGVTGLRSAIFVQRVEGTTDKFYIADDLPSEMGTVFALKPKEDPNESDLYPYEIEIIME